MNDSQHNAALALLHAVWADKPTQTVADWCVANLRFDEPDNTGPYTLAGRNYTREILNAWADMRTTDMVFVKGSQAGGTASVMGGALWTMVNHPTRFLWVMPTKDVSSSFVNTRLLPMFRTSPVFAGQLPKDGARGGRFNTKKIQCGGSIIEIVWSNSPAALSSVPARVVVLDEVDKFAVGGKREANAVSLAQQRTKNFACPKRVKVSTPSMTDGLIWQEFLKTDQRRRYLPCPFCKKFFVIAWKKEYTVFKLTGDEALVDWDAEAKRKDGTWDMDRVERSAHATCPHCAGHIRDAHKTLMDRGGEWRPTAQSHSGYRGWHLPSLNAASAQANFGKLAVKFLQEKASYAGLQGFVNGDLAEPWENQESREARTEILSPINSPPIEGALALMTVDVQQLAPKFWFVVRAWKNDSRLIDCGAVETWEELRAKQVEHGVADNHVGVDSGFSAEEVYAECMRWGRMKPRMGQAPIWVGWTPMKGFARRNQWRRTTGEVRPYSIGRAALPSGHVQLPLLEFSDEHSKDYLARLRRGLAGVKWEVKADVDQDYFRHLDAEVKKSVAVGRTGRVVEEWTRRSKHWPNHMLDCEVMQVVMALLHRVLNRAPEKKERTPRHD